MTAYLLMFPSPEFSPNFTTDVPHSASYVIPWLICQSLAGTTHMGPDNVTVHVKYGNCLCYFIILGLKRVMFPSSARTVKICDDHFIFLTKINQPTKCVYYGNLSDTRMRIYSVFPLKQNNKNCGALEDFFIEMQSF